MTFSLPVVLDLASLRTLYGTGATPHDVLAALTPAAFGHFVAAIASPLGIGKITLADGSKVSGFLCEPWATQNAPDITHLGGWREYLISDQ